MAKVHIGRVAGLACAWALLIGAVVLLVMLGEMLWKTL